MKKHRIHLGMETRWSSRGGLCSAAILGILLAALSLLGAPAQAQLTTADLTGTVTDTSGAVVPNATVRLVNLGTHEMRVGTTNGAGVYTFTFLQAGQYSVKVEAKGFRTATMANLTLQAGDHGRGDTQLEVGQSDMTVEVSGVNPLLQTEDSTLSSTIVPQQVEDLPTSGRNLTSLVFLNPGVNEAASVDTLSSGQRPDDRRQTSSFSVNGGDPQLNNNQLDGEDNNERIIGTIGVKPSLDMIEQVTVETSDFTPESGRSAGGVIAVITKRGTNQIHGSLYAFVENNMFNGNNPFNYTGPGTAPLPTPELDQNDFGGSVGGPIRRNKTFFFAGYEGLRLVNAANAAYNFVPDQANYAAIQSGNVTSIINSNPYTYGMTADPIALNYAKIYPAPNSTSSLGNFVMTPKHTMYSTTIDGRVDHSLTDRDLLFVRYTSNDVTSYIPTGMPSATINGVSINPGNGQYGYAGPAKNQAYNSQVDYTHIFGSNLLAESKLGYTRIYNHSNSPNSGTGADKAVGFPGSSFNGATGTGLPLASVAGYAPLGDSNFVPLTDLSNTFELNGAITYTLGRHQFKAGAVVIYRQAQEMQSNNGIGSLNFSDLGIPGDDATESELSLAEMLVGAFDDETRSINLYTPNYRSWEPGFYVQDAWKANSRLTLNYGMRYDVYTPFTEAHGYISNYDLATRELLVPRKGLAFLESQGANTAGIVGASKTAGIETDFENFEPRLGFAYATPTRTVVRGGVGVAFYPTNYTSNASMKNAPFSAVYAPSVNGQGCISAVSAKVLSNYNRANPGSPISILPVCNLAGQTDTLAAGIPIPAPQGLFSANLGLPDNVALNYRNSSNYQFNLMVEQQLGNFVAKVGYAGQLGRHLPATFNDINVPDPHTALGIAGCPSMNASLCALSVRPTQMAAANAPALPNLGGVGMVETIGSSHYNGLQASLERRYANGMTVNANYTWSHEIDDTTGLSYEGQEGWGNLDPFDIGHYEKGNGDMDLRHRLALAATYALPFFKSATGPSKMLLSGWQTNGIYIYNSGSPFSITDNWSYPGDSIYNGIGGGPTRPMMIANPHLAHPKAGVRGLWFNNQAFKSPLWGEMGNTPRNNLYGPHFQHLDFSIFKDFPVGERAKIEFRAESFNLANHPNFFVENDQNDMGMTNETPVWTNIPPAGSPFGYIGTMSPNYTPRELQFALKVLF